MIRTGLGEDMIPVRQHAQRLTLTDEVHARPYQAMVPPERVTHFAFITGETAPSVGSDREHLSALCKQFGIESPDARAKHFSADFGDFRLKWERHTEFTTYTIFAHGAVDDPLRNSAADLLPTEWRAEIRGEMLVATNAALVTKENTAPVEPDAGIFVRDSLCCCLASDEGAIVWTDFRIHDDGFSRFLIEDRGLVDRRAGRLVQRLLDIETYRTMALLALPEAQRVGPIITEIDRKLAQLIGSMKSMESVSRERELLENLTALAAEVEALQSGTAYRLSAARAYDALVRARIEELRESRVHGWQTIEEFMIRRFTPAMRTCRSVGDRLDLLSRRVTRASTLLRTRVDIALEDQSQSLLSSVERSSRRQLRLQQTVEGLSVAAISYYLLGLISYSLAAVEKVAPAVPAKIVTGAAVPFIVLVVWYGIRRMRRRYEKAN
jgi:uncharacterized membrane-anchored protein